jgi:small multidrug resistance pump
MMSYVLLIGSILFEVMGTTCMKLSDGFDKVLPSVFIFVFYGISFVLFTLALKNLDVSMAYAIWAGLGTVIITIIGIFYFNEPGTLFKLFSIILVIAGVIGLNLTGTQ